jgi:ribosomal protein S18 acetylase RimI-like enzyme
MRIRRAVAVDEENVCSLWETLLHFYGKEKKGTVLQRSFRYAVSHPAQIRIFVAEEEGQILGTASLHLGHYSTWSDQWYGHVEDVVVAPADRGRGVGEALVRRVVKEASLLGLCRLELCVLVNNESARKLYEKIGFKTDSVVYELPLEQRKKSTGTK